MGRSGEGRERMGRIEAWREILEFLRRVRIKPISYFYKAMTKIPGENKLMGRIIFICGLRGLGLQLHMAAEMYLMANRRYIERD